MGSTHSTERRTHNTGLRARRRRARRLGVTWLVGAIALAGCGGDDSDASDEPAAEEAAADFGDGTVDGDERIAIEAGDAPAEPAGGVNAGGSGFDLGAVGRDVIIEMRVSMTSDDLQRSVAAVTADAAALGGGVASSDVNYGSTDEPDGRLQGYAVLVVKVPPDAVDRFLTRLDAAGTVRSIGQSAQDVTEQLVDLDVRIANARQSVDSVRSFMEQTENLSELVSLESELTSRRTALERLEAQQRSLRDRVALSTITVEVLPAPAVPEAVGDAGRGSIADALRTGWDAFVATVFTIGLVVAVLLPFLVIGAIVLGAILLVRRQDRVRVPEASGDAPDEAAEGVMAESSETPTTVG